MEKKNNYLLKLINYIEYIIAFVLIIAIIVTLIIFLLINAKDMFSQTFNLDSFLGAILTIVVAIEFAKMLLLHTPESVMEVVLYAVARQIILSHDHAMENLIGVIAVLVIFIIRKYLSNDKNNLQS